MAIPPQRNRHPTQEFSKEGFIPDTVKTVRRTKEEKTKERYRMLPRSVEL